MRVTTVLLVLFQSVNNNNFAVSFELFIGY